MASTKIKLNQLFPAAGPGYLIQSDGSNIPTYLAPSAGTNHLLYYKTSTGQWTPLTLGTNLTFNTTTNELDASAGAGGYATAQEEGATVGGGNTTLNFIGSGITAANAGGGVTSVTIATFLNTLATAGSVSLTAHVSGTLPVANGGTGLTAGTSGGVLYYSGSGVLASSGALTDNVIVVGGGAGSAPTSLGAGLGTTTTVLHGNAAGEPTWGAVSLSADVTGTLGVTNGGTGFSSYTTGDLIMASSSTTLSRLADVATGSVLKSGGVGVIPSWGTLASTDLSNSANIALLNATQTFTNTITFSNAPQYAGTPSGGNDLTNVTYVTNSINTALAGLRKGSVRVATTANGTLATAFANGQTVDTVTLATGNLILLKNQSAQAENGVYVVQASGAPIRASWMDSAAEIDGVYVAVEDGGQAGTLWITVSEVTTLNTDAIVFTQIQTSGAVASVTITQPAAGITITNSGSAQTGATSSVFSLANDLLALENLASTGFAVRTAGDTWAQRQITGTTNRITVNNGTGVTTDPSIDIHASYVGQASITTLGTITTGTWHGTTIAVANGGTGVTATTIGGILVGSSTSAFTNLTIGGANTVLTSNGTTATWAAPAAPVITEAYVVLSAGSTTVDMDLNVGNVKDVDGNNIAFTVPTDLKLLHVYRNGQRMYRSGSVTRDYSVSTSTHVITFSEALATDDLVYVYKFG